MDPGPVYSGTTEPKEQASRAQRRVLGCGCTSARLGWRRLLLKAAQALFSFLAFVLEEIVDSCTQCGGLYFFEFISFLATFVSCSILTVYCTSAYEKVEKKRVQKLDLVTTPLVGGLFFLASVVFAATSDKTSVETAAIVFGFLASIAFVVDGIQMYMETRQKKEGKLENASATQITAENQPLNNPN